jgi:hypothetical protein
MLVSQTLTQLKKEYRRRIEFRISISLKLLFGGFGEYTYDSNPKVTLTNDAQASVNNTNPVLILVKLHSKITSKQECHNALIH